MTNCARCGCQNMEDTQYCTECGRVFEIPQEKPYPLYFKGELTEPLDPILFWLKPITSIPHHVVLGFLWVGFTLSWLISLFAILIIGKYPRALFDFNLGVLRWSWRVDFYGIGVLGTDRYPPFTLKSVDYPADLGIPYPEKLSRRLAVVKLFLLVFFLVYTATRWLVASAYTQFIAQIYFFTFKYPRDSFDFLYGFGCLTYRMAAYMALMTDRFPPFRLGGPMGIEKPIAEPLIDASLQKQPDGADISSDHDTIQSQKTGIQPGMADASAVKYAGFWRRLGASFIDSTIIYMAILIIPFIINVAFNPEEDNNSIIGVVVGVVYYSILLIAGWLYYALMESSSRQTTLGKMMLGIIVTDNRGEKISFGRATGRYFAKIVSMLVLFIGFLMIPFTKKKQGLHDMMAHTFIVRK